MKNVVLSKWGNSLGLRIPKYLVETLDLKEGEELELNLSGDKIEISKPSSLKAEDIVCAFYNKPYEELINTVELSDGELGWGEDVGGEVIE